MIAQSWGPVVHVENLDLFIRWGHWHSGRDWVQSRGDSSFGNSSDYTRRALTLVSGLGTPRGRTECSHWEAGHGWNEPIRRDHLERGRPLCCLRQEEDGSGPGPPLRAACAPLLRPPSAPV